MQLPSVTVGEWISHEPVFKRNTRKSIHFSNCLSCKNCALNRAVLVFPCVKKWCSRSCCLVFSSMQKSCSSPCFFFFWCGFRENCSPSCRKSWSGSFFFGIHFRAKNRALDRARWRPAPCKKSCSRTCSLVFPCKNRALDRALWCSPLCKNRVVACESCYRQWARPNLYVYLSPYLHIYLYLYLYLVECVGFFICHFG